MAETRRAEFVAGLRELADLLEKHPDIPEPIMSANAFVDTREELAKVARLGFWEKCEQGEWFILARNFSAGLRLEVNINRSKVCKRKVVGTRVVPARPERTEEIIEWICAPILPEET